MRTRDDDDADDDGTYSTYPHSVLHLCERKKREKEKLEFESHLHGESIKWL